MKKRLFLIPTLGTTFFVMMMVLFLRQYFTWRPPRLRFLDYISSVYYYNRHYKIPYTKLRDYVDIHFTGNRWQDEVKLQFAELRVNEILAEGDTVHGVHFSFGDSATYEFVVRTQYLLIAAHAKTWVNNSGEVWFVVMPKDVCPPHYKGIEGIDIPDM